MMACVIEFVSSEESSASVPLLNAIMPRLADAEPLLIAAFNLLVSLYTPEFTSTQVLPM
jgi:hypothetical protein